MNPTSISSLLHDVLCILTLLANNGDSIDHTNHLMVLQVSQSKFFDIDNYLPSSQQNSVSCLTLQG